ncbi:AAA family ATPase [Paenibacillus roseipurpureus]|uniref:AAA family ATPase n=1 Tax=Paenibacillus roseopurpureus TaxID=2918901 RepID=A0AA96LJK9_9BACL|nr:AAA family ATPase [Paenibacillus sp. MBLB1832]WNR43082.1 AAA family ATPase [Paenibacillus sp. MBLB1832]
MRIVAIHIDGFGHIRNREWHTDSGLALFYGANEAGKSTLMGFVRAVLFGFPTRTNRAERYEPLGGGAHGGALTLLDEQGQRIRVERFDAPAAGGRRASAGLVKVTLADGTTGGEELLNTLLGGLSADLYRSLFAFGLTELQELRTLQTDELSGYLYSAGLGVSGSAIMEAERKLTAQADSLYRPRGRTQEMNRLLRELEGLEQALRRSRDGAADYDRLQEERRTAEARAAALEGQQEALRAELHRLGLAGKARSGWLRLRQIGRELEGLPARPGFPAQAAARLAALESEQERLQAERDKLQLGLDSLRGELAALPLEPALLQHQVELNHWLAQAATYDEHKRQRDQLDVELSHQRAQIDRLLSNLDVQWNEHEVSSFPITIALREQIRIYKEKFRQSAEQEHRIRAELENLQEQLARWQENVDALETECQQFRLGMEGEAMHGAPGMLDDPTSLVQQIANDYARWQVVGSQLAHQAERQAEQGQFQQSLEETARAGRAAARQMRSRLLMMLILLAILLPLIVGWQTTWFTAGALFLGIAGITAYFWLTGRQDEGKRATRAMPAVTTALVQNPMLEQELKQLEGRIQERVRQYQRQQRMNTTALQEVAVTTSREGRNTPQIALQELHFYIEAWFREAELSKHHYNEQLRKLEKLRDMREHGQSLQKQFHARNQFAEQFRNEAAQLQMEWKVWLQQLGVGDHPSTEALTETLQVIEQAQEGLRHLQKMKAKYDAFEAAIHDFEEGVSELLGLPAHSQDIIFALKRWKEAEQNQLRVLSEEKQAQQKLVETEHALQLVAGQQQRIDSRVQQLFAEASVRDGEGLRIAEEEEVARQKLEEEASHLQASLECVVSASGMASMIDLLESHGEEELAQLVTQGQLNLSEMITQTNAIREVIGKLTGQIEKLEQGEEAANQRLQAESLRTTISQQVHQYAVVSFAAQLLKKARDVYEQERQPGVLLRASAYFGTMTNGAFTAVKAPFGEQRLLAVRANGQVVETNQLSRGTAEQLYLAMRFALVEEYAGKAVLPLVLDDILVNFDEERMESCLRVLSELSTRHQILLFTCHKHVRDAAKRVIPGHLSIQV